MGAVVYAWREARGMTPGRFVHHGPLAPKDLEAVETGTAGFHPLLLHQLGYTLLRAACLEAGETAAAAMGAAETMADEIAGEPLRDAFLAGARLARGSLRKRS